MTHNYVAIGTGYGVGDDFRHGQYRGELWVDGKTWPMAELERLGVVRHRRPRRPVRDL